MAMTLARAAPRALVVPDTAFWAAAGVDVEGLDVEPVASPDRADLMLVSAVVPRGLEDAVRDARARLRDPGAVRIAEGPAIAGEDAEAVLGHERPREREEGEESEDDEDGEHESHDHDDMMAVTGEPSSDGLVMEDAEATVGPLGPALATGVVWHATLDGDVVCQARIDSALRGAVVAGDAAEPLAPLASRWAAERARQGPDPSPRVPLRVAAVELERALSHMAWLARFASTLGASGLADRLRGAAGPLIRGHAAFLRRSDQAPDLGELGAVRETLESARPTRTMRPRLRGVGRISAHECRERGVRGVVARATGLRDDARGSDPGYRELGFSPVTREGGDALARTELRIGEALVALDLAERALREPALPPGDGPVEGPRGPFDAADAGPSGAPAVAIPGGEATVALSARSACGHELAAAVVALASFDLSPGQVRR